MFGSDDLDKHCDVYAGPVEATILKCGDAEAIATQPELFKTTTRVKVPSWSHFFQRQI